jgi:membrane fusion protein, multidrug efflux system
MISIRYLGLVLATMLLSACSQKTEAPTAVRPVLIQEIIATDGLQTDVYSGELRARYETDLAFRIGGKVQRRLVDTGARVKRGQTLATLDPVDASLAADAAKASLAGAESDLAFARAELERHRDLLSKNFISKAVFDNKQNAFNAAQARVQQTRAQAGINVNQAGYTTLVADADGVVATTQMEVGQVVAAGQPVMRIAKDGDRDVAVNIPEGKITLIRQDMPARVFLWTDPNAAVTGKVREVSAVADAITRTYVVRVSVPTLPPGAQLGMTASVVVGTPTAPQIIVPLSAIVKRTEAANAGVWVVNKSTRRVALRPVVVAKYSETGAVISSGLQPGDTIVTAGAHRLLPDQEVILPAPKPSAPAARTVPAEPVTKAGA